LTKAPTDATPRKPLRLWPGVVAVILVFVARFGVKAAIPGFGGFALAMQWSFGAAGLVLLWWLFFSRARWFERLGGLGLMIAGLGAAWQLRHPSMGPAWLFAYALPFLWLALLVGAAAGRRLPDGPRRAVLAASILLACGVWTLVRTEGIDGDHVADFEWRWAKTAEQRLLTEAGREPAVRPSVPPAAGPTPMAQVSDPPATLASAPPAPEAPSERAVPSAGEATAEPTAAGSGANPPADWPGFRGPGRDGIVRGVRIETDWAASPPVELWRRPVGPGWSSFAVRGRRLYTQEQRGEDEIVASYDTTTGEPVWTHHDAVRFFESNAGAGPRATPTLDDDLVYAFGATGILNALHAGDGTVAWSRDVASETRTKVPTWGFSGSPLVTGDLVIVAASGQLAAYDRVTGAPRWHGPAGGTSYSSPRLLTTGGVAQVLLMSAAGATSVAVTDGKPLWEHPWRGFPIVQPGLIADGDLLITASGESGTRRIAVTHDGGKWTVHERWSSIGLKPYFNDFVLHEGHAFGFDGRILACLDLENGTRKWKGGRYGNGQLVLLPDQDLLLVLSEEGELALVRATPDQFTELARFPALEGKTWNHPAVAGDVLLVRNGEQMAAFRLATERR
jgi:outer membrane protein assembly factor BamB